ncbi:phosphatidylglycerol lysyltransferase domain-containing protein [Frankia sp. R82]|uniref:phosphatidylglycerol lysyltransferase domain-containing protein n=1 Tax=Frankia sp. R82 TaxID=2950553 RepID=UPI0020430FA2|nr:phosphatidylglycerol lysyltransferase domain-containing protein [Frankia sp. R82]MCM3882546.1 phosphatidylglycerol lysyltransferase domain-containing protein [Frankia sp. R82]
MTSRHDATVPPTRSPSARSPKPNPPNCRQPNSRQPTTADPTTADPTTADPARAEAPAAEAPKAGARWRRLPTPALIAALTALVGLVDVVIAISHRPTRWTWIGRMIPGLVTDAATGTSVGAGLLLIGLAHGLRRRKRRAWRAAVILSGAAMLLDLARGFVVAAAVLDAIPFAVLLATRRRFHAAGDPRTRRRALGALAALAVADLTIGLSLIRFRHGRGDLRAQLAHVLAGLVGVSGPVHFGPRDGDLVGSVLLALGAVTVGVTGYLALRPARPVNVLTEDDGTRLRALLARHGRRDPLGYAALRQDNSVLWSPSGKAAITYRVVGGVALACGDPLGDPEAWPGAIGPFLELAAAHAWVPAAVGCGPEGGRVWQRAGLRVLELGDQAVVHTAQFRLDDPCARDLRQTVTRFEHAGHTARIDRVGELSDDERTALAERATGRRTRAGAGGHPAALGRVVALADPDCVVVRAFHHDQLCGLLTLVPWGRDGLSLDMIHRERTVAGGLTEFMLVALLRDARRLGIARVSLTFTAFRTALARGERLGASPALRLWRRVLLGASRWFQIESLYRFNARFAPDWQPRYVCWPDARDLPRVLVAAMRAEVLVPRPTLLPCRPRWRADSPATAGHATDETEPAADPDETEKTAEDMSSSGDSAEAGRRERAPGSSGGSADGHREPSSGRDSRARSRGARGAQSRERPPRNSAVRSRVSSSPKQTP